MSQLEQENALLLRKVHQQSRRAQKAEALRRKEDNTVNTLDEKRNQYRDESNGEKTDDCDLELIDFSRRLFFYGKTLCWNDWQVYCVWRTQWCAFHFQQSWDDFEVSM